MTDAFDPYHRWLGIPAEEQPANHYRLLGLVPSEDDPEVIRDAAERQISHVRRYALGKHAALSQKILNELAAATACLLDPASKAVYDAQLRRLPTRSMPVAPPPSLSQEPKSVPPPISHVLSDGRPLSVEVPASIPAPPAEPPASSLPGSSATATQSFRSRLWIAGGASALGVLLLGMALFWAFRPGPRPAPPPSSANPPSPSAAPAAPVVVRPKRASTATHPLIPPPATTPYVTANVPQTPPELQPPPAPEKPLFQTPQRREMGWAAPQPPVEVMPQPASREEPLPAESAERLEVFDRVALPSGRTLSVNLFDVDQQLRKTARTLWETSGAEDLLRDRLPENLVKTRAANQPIVACFWYPDKSVQALVSHKRGTPEGPAIAFYKSSATPTSSIRRGDFNSRSPYQFYWMLHSADLKPQSFVNYDSGKLDGWLRTWHENGQKHYWCEYVRGKRNGLACLFKADQPRLIVEYTNHAITAIHLIAGNQVVRTFSESDIQTDAEAASLFDEMLQFHAELDKNEIRFKKNVEDVDDYLQRMVVATSNREKRARASERREQHAREVDSIFRSLRTRSGL
jgi:hypothetical protein